MVKLVKERRPLFLFISILMVFAVVLGFNSYAYAREDESTRYVNDLVSFYRALTDGYVTHIIVTEDIDFNCHTCELGGTSRYIIDRTLTIEGSDPGITLRRVIDDNATNGDLQSLFAIFGGGSAGYVNVTFKNITLDGGAYFGSYTGYDRVTNYDNILRLGGACGRSLIDINGKGTVSLREGTTIQNCYCTNPMSTLNTSDTTPCYGAAIRIEFSDYQQGYGGTLNMYDGAVIKNCVASNACGESYGGAIGAYALGQVNMYGGTIENCSAHYGGAIGCAYKNFNKYSTRTSGVFRMEGGRIRLCSAFSGGAIYAEGSNQSSFNYLLGGTIEGCTVKSAGKGPAIAIVAGSDSKYTKTYLNPYDPEDGPLFVNICTGSNDYTDPNTVYSGKTLGYNWFSMGNGNNNVVINDPTVCKIRFKLTADAEDYYASYNISPGESLGSSFPRNPSYGNYQFIEWNTSPDGTGTTVTSSMTFNQSTTVYARWLVPDSYNVVPENIDMTYGDTGNTITVESGSAYGSGLRYSWKTCDANGNVTGTVDGATDRQYVIPRDLPAGTHYFKCYVTQTGNTSGGKYTPLVTVVVNKKPVTITWGDTEFVYDGYEKIPVATVSAGLVSGHECGASATGAQINSGSNYIATATLIGDDAVNYVIGSGATTSFVIHKRSVNIIWSDTDLTYDGSLKAPTPEIGGIANWTECRVIANGAQTAAGTYTATAQIIGDNAYNFTIASGETYTFTINKKPVSVSWSNTEFNYNGSVRTPSAALVGIVGNDNCYAQVSGGTKDAGSHTATASLAGTDKGNYVISSNRETSFTINPKTVTLSWSDTTLVYNKSAQKPSAVLSGVLSSDDCSASVSGAKTKPGTYTATATLIGSDRNNYVISGASSTSFEIVKKPVTISWTNTVFEYDGTVKKPTAALSGVMSGDDCRVSVSGGSASVGVHTATAALYGNDCDNYVISGSDSTEYTIAANVVTITWSDTEFNYDGKVKTPKAALSGLDSGVDLNVTVTGGTKAAGTHTAKAVLSGADAANYLIAGGDEISFTINPKTVTINWSNTTKVYNGSTFAPSASVSGKVSGDSLSVSVTGGKKAVGTYTATAVLTGTDAGNYVIRSGYDTCSFSISHAPLNISWSNTSFVYDGTVKAPSATVSGVCAGDVVNSGPNTGHSAVGSYTVMATLTGSDARNYYIASGASCDYTISAKQVTINWTNKAFTYDGTVKTPSAELVGVVSGDACSLTVSGGAKNVGTHQAQASLTGSDASNYVISGSSSTSFTISKKTVAITWGNTSFAYDGSVKTPSAGLSGVASGTDCTVTVTGGTKTAGSHTAKAVLSGTDAGNYALSGSDETTFTIAPKELTITWTNRSFTYDGTMKTPKATLSGVVGGEVCKADVAGSAKTAGDHRAMATLTGADAANYVLPESSRYTTFTISPATVYIVWSDKVFDYDGKVKTPKATLSGVISGTDCSTSVTGGSKSAGSHTATCELTGTDSANYQISGDNTVRFYINPKKVTVTWSQTSLVYNGKTQKPSVSLSGFISGDDCTAVVSGGKTKVGNYTASVSFTGADKDNYVINGDYSVSFAITAKPVTVSWPVTSFPFTGNIITPSADLNGVVEGDDCYASVTGGSADVGTHTATAALAGSDKGNYILSGSNQTRYDIRAKSATINWTVTSFVYTGQQIAPTAVLNGVASGDDCYVTVTGGQTAAGTYTATAVLAGADKDKYAIFGDDQTSFTISPKPITVNWSNKSLEYNGNTRTPTATLSGVVSGDNCKASVSGGAKTVGTHTAKATLSGTSAANYVISGSNETSFTITPKKISVSWSNTSYTYDGDTHVPKATLSGVIGSDVCTVTVSGGKKDAGTHTAKATLSGKDKGNYQISGSDTGTFYIWPKTVTLSWAGSSFDYNGKIQKPFAYVNGTIPGDSVEAEVSGGNKDIGSYTASASLTGASASNYIIDSDYEYHSYTINRKTLEISWTETNFIFDGQIHTPVVNVSGLVTGDDVDYVISGGKREAGSNYTATLSLKGIDKDNYLIPSNDKTCKFNIAQRPLTVIWSDTELPYDGTLKAPTATLKNVPSGINVSASVWGAQREIGHYTAEAYLSGSDKNNCCIYGDSTVEFSIGRAVSIEWSDTEFVYDGTVKTPVARITGGVDSYDDCTVVVTGGTSSAGTYTATASLEGYDASNYAIAGDHTVSFTIAPKEVTISWTNLDLTYNGKTQAPKASVSGVIDGDDCKVKVQGGEVSAGSYVATATLTGKAAANYVIAEGYATTSYTIAEAPAEPSVPPTTKPSVSLTLDKKSVSVVCGKTVTLKATVKGSTSDVKWKSSDSKVATVDINGKVSAKMAGAVTITASCAGKSVTAKVTVLYKDVTDPSEFWFEPTNYLTAKGVVKGYANQTEFRPGNDCTRAQMVTFLYRLQGEPKPKSSECKFPDVKSSDYFYKPVIWAVEQGITTGYSDGTFKPQNVCTRAQTVTFMWRMAGKPDSKLKDNPFKDVKNSDYFYKATLWASEMKILAGYSDGTFRPEGLCLRRQMVTFLYKYDKYVNGNG